MAGKPEEADKLLDKARKLMTKALDGCHQLDYHMFGKWAERVDALEERPDQPEFSIHVVAENAAELTRDSF